MSSSQFYRTYPLAEGLGPGQESAVAREPAAVQQTLNAVRVVTLAAVNNQQSRISGFTNTFVDEALTGADSDLYGGQPLNFVPDATADGTFVTTQDNDPEYTGTFTPDAVDGNPRNFLPLNVVPAQPNVINRNSLPLLLNLADNSSPFLPTDSPRFI